MTEREKLIDQIEALIDEHCHNDPNEVIDGKPNWLAWRDEAAKMLKLLPPVAPAGDREAVDDAAKAEGMDEAADFVLEHLAKALGLTTFEPQEGSETWDGDVVATLNHILVAAGVVDDETGSVCVLSSEHRAVIEAAQKYAEHRRIGRLFTDQDVLDAVAALCRARTGSEAQ